MKKSILAVIALLGLIGYGIYDHLNEKPEERTSTQTAALDDNVAVGIEKGQLAPNFELDDMNGIPSQLSDYRGKIVLVNFWATWCPPCRAEMPHMQQFYEDYKNELVILGVNLTATETDPEAIEPFIDEFGLTFPIVLDHEGNVMTDFQVIGYPTTYVIDDQGIIREVFRGAINYEIMQKTIEKL